MVDQFSVRQGIENRCDKIWRQSKIDLWFSLGGGTSWLAANVNLTRGVLSISPSTCHRDPRFSTHPGANHHRNPNISASNSHLLLPSKPTTSKRPPQAHATNPPKCPQPTTPSKPPRTQRPPRKSTQPRAPSTTSAATATWTCRSSAESLSDAGTAVIVCFTSRGRTGK
jgi:hypothetical protein